MYGLAQSTKPETPAESSYAKAFKLHLLKGEIPVPQSDADAGMLIKQSKAAMDANPDHQEKQAHVDAVVKALHEWHKTKPSSLSRKLIDGIHADPHLTISIPHPDKK